MGFPGGSVVENLPQYRRHRLDPWVRKSPGKGKGNTLHTNLTQSLLKSQLPFTGTDKLILKFTCKVKGPRIAKQSWKRTKLEDLHFPIWKLSAGTSLVVQWLRFHTSISLRSRMLHGTAKKRKLSANLSISQQSWFQLVSHPAWHFAWCTLHIS